MSHSHAGAKQMNLTGIHDKTVGYEYPILQVYQMNLHPFVAEMKETCQMLFLDHGPPIHGLTKGGRDCSHEEIKRYRKDIYLEIKI